VNIEWSQISALGVLAAAAAVCVVLLVGFVSLLRRMGKWIAGGNRPREAQTSVKPEAVSSDSVVTASDIFAIRSNLAAVSRQLEDLENKLRLNPPKR
jgi:hypothetical protein